MERFLNFWCQ